MFSYLSLEQRVPADHPLRVIRGDRGPVPCGTGRSFQAHLFPFWLSFRSPGASPSCLAAASLFQHPPGAATDGADGLQPAVPLVRGSGVRRIP